MGRGNIRDRDDRNTRGGARRFGGGDSNRGGFDFNRSFSNLVPRDMHKATCADCGAECEVPFKPTEGRPVYCRQCYGKHKKPSSF